MRTFKLPDLWFKTVQGTELESFDWFEIAQVLSTKGIIEVFPPTGAAEVGRYKLNHSALSCERTRVRETILDILRYELPKLTRGVRHEHE